MEQKPTDKNILDPNEPGISKNEKKKRLKRIKKMEEK